LRQVEASGWVYLQRIGAQLGEVWTGDWTKLFVATGISRIMSILNEMNSPELEALAAELHAQIDRSADHSEMPKIKLEDVKGWIALHREESESHFDFSFFLNLV
jgi:hypothetical protein